MGEQYSKVKQRGGGSSGSVCWLSFALAPWLSSTVVRLFSEGFSCTECSEIMTFTGINQPNETPERWLYSRKTKVLWKPNPFVPLCACLYERVKWNKRAFSLKCILVAKDRVQLVGTGRSALITRFLCDWIFMISKYRLMTRDIFVSLYKCVDGLVL